MNVIVVSSLAVVIYAGAVLADLSLTIVLYTGVAVVTVSSAIVGAAIGHKDPARSALATTTWTSFTWLLAAAATAGLAHLGIVVVAGDDASREEKALAALSAAALVAAGEHVSKVLRDHDATWFRWFVASSPLPGLLRRPAGQARSRT